MQTAFESSISILVPTHPSPKGGVSACDLCVTNKLLFIQYTLSHRPDHTTNSLNLKVEYLTHPLLQALDLSQLEPPTLKLGVR